MPYRMGREEIMFQMTNISVMWSLPLLLIIKIMMIIIIVLASCIMIFSLGAQRNKIPYYFHLYIAHQVRRGLGLLSLFFICKKIREIIESAGVRLCNK